MLQISKSISRKLTVCGAATLTWIHVAAEPLPPELLDGLTSQEFRVRENAQAALLDWAREKTTTRAILLLEQARKAEDPEVRKRCHDVLRAIAMDAYHEGGEGYMGITMAALRAKVPDEDGEARAVIAITQVMPDSPAQEAGLRVGDFITSVNGRVFGQEDPLAAFQQMIRELKPGKVASFGVLRDEKLLSVDVVLGRRPPMLDAGFFNRRMEDLHDLARREQEEFFRNWIAGLDK